MDLFMNRTYEIPLDQCFNALLGTLPAEGLMIYHVFEGERRINAYWSYILPRLNLQNRPDLAPRYDLEALCIPLGSNSTEVRLVYRPDLTPAKKRPMQSSLTVQAIIAQKLHDLHSKLSLALGVLPPEAPPKAKKLKRLAQKWLWFDWVLFIIICSPVLVLANNRWGSSIGSRFLIGGVVGGVCSVIYSLTFHRLWVRVFPEKYAEWVCSNCNNVVPVSESQCPICLRDFEE